MRGLSADSHSLYFTDQPTYDSNSDGTALRSTTASTHARVCRGSLHDNSALDASQVTTFGPVWPYLGRGHTHREHSGLCVAGASDGTPNRTRRTQHTWHHLFTVSSTTS